MAFLLNINGTNRSVESTAMFGCGSQTGSSDTIAINQVRRS